LESRGCECEGTRPGNRAEEDCSQAKATSESTTASKGTLREGESVRQRGQSGPLIKDEVVDDISSN
jgi:hypothetical protein